jgi:hypothetical protein
MDSHPYEGTATELADDGISDSEAQMLAKRLAEAKQRIEQLEGYKEAAIKAMGQLFKCEADEMPHAETALMLLKRQCQEEYSCPSEAIDDVLQSAEGSS